jgi:diadenylate cyclase
LDTSDILSDLGQFLSKLFKDITSGLLFFGGALDIITAFFDILVTALVIYYILKIIRDSRAWQLLKGLILILVFAAACSLLGLSTVGFLLNNTISVLAIAFVVIFQPELRRALEAFGRNSFNVFSAAITQDDSERRSGSIHNLIESIVRACEKLSETRTGALIIIERQTRLGELVEQENVVLLDSTVSATMLLQVFYKGSPLHDGAALIRDGRLTAARIHVPLSDNYHLRKDYGTRHRAAVGASEMGDAIAVVVSEEHGSIGIAIEGRLYILESTDALRNMLHKLLGPNRNGAKLGGFLRTNLRLSRSQGQDQDAAAEVPEADQAETDSAGGPSDGNIGDKPVSAARPSIRTPRRQRISLMILSLAIAIVLWLYIQVTYNPVDSRNLTVPLAYRGTEQLQAQGLEIQKSSQNILVNVQARKKNVERLTAEDITAYVDLSEIKSTGKVELEVKIDKNALVYLETKLDPQYVTITVVNKTDG